MSLGLSPPEVVTVAPAFDIIEGIFFAVYLLDVVVRMIVLRKEWYFDEVEGIMYMNMFDAILVLVHGFELMLLPVSSSQHSNHSFNDPETQPPRMGSGKPANEMLRFTGTYNLVGTCPSAPGIFSAGGSAGCLDLWQILRLFLLKKSCCKRFGSPRPAAGAVGRGMEGVKEEGGVTGMGKQPPASRANSPCFRGGLGIR